MRISALAVVVAVGAALAAGGALRNVPREPPRRWWLVPLAVVVLATATVLPVLTVVALVALVAFAVSNLRMMGMAVVLVGLVLNLAVIVANGAMPVDPAAVVAAGLADEDDMEMLALGAARRWQQPGDRISALGDVVPVAALGEVVSFGDLILAAGLADVSFRLLRPARIRSRLAPARRRTAGHGRRSVLSTPSPAR